LNVYFNKFVSGEGVDASIPDRMRLLDSDFDPYTGYPKLDSAVFDKLRLLGETYCGSRRIFTGAAFGKYIQNTGRLPYEFDPATDLPNNIVTKVTDAQNPADDGNEQSIEGSKGFVRFNEGRRWNHHLYCGSIQ
jgi:hypothetical protein